MPIKASLERFTQKFRRSRPSSPALPDTGQSESGHNAALPTDASPSNTPSPLQSPPVPGAAPEGTVAGQNATTVRTSPQGTDELVADAALAVAHASRLGGKTGAILEGAPDAWETAESTWSIFTDVASGLKFVSKAIDAIGEIHPYVHAAVSIVEAVVKPIVNQDARDKAFEELLEELLRTYRHVKEELSLSIVAPPRKLVSYETEVLCKIAEETKKCALFIKNEYIAQGFWKRAAKNTTHGGDADEKIKEYTKRFAILRDEWRDAKLGYLDAAATLNRLERVLDTGRTGAKACLPNTRQQVLERISAWMSGPDGARALYVVGVAGCGKTAIAHSVALSLMKAQEPIQCAFFAFDHRLRNDRAPYRLFPTLAYDLALRNDSYRRGLVQELKSKPHLANSKDVSEQWDNLILEPIKGIPSGDRVLFVIDALDECPRESEDGSWETMLRILTARVSELPPNVRVLVTSRPDPEFKRATAHADRLDLGDYSSQDDILLYVRGRMLDRGNDGLSDSECEELARGADGLFQWATTACAYLRYRLGGTTAREKFRADKQLLLRGEVSLPNGRPRLALLYDTVLSGAFDPESPAAMGRFRRVMSLVFCASEPLSVSALCAFYLLGGGPSGYQDETVQQVLGHLGVVLEGISDGSTSPVRPMHLSFRDFLLDESRSGSWHIGREDVETGHRIMALGSLRFLNNNLTFNIYNLPSSCITDDSALSQPATSLFPPIFGGNKGTENTKIAENGLKMLTNAFSMPFVPPKTGRKGLAAGCEILESSQLPPGLAYAAYFWVYHLAEVVFRSSVDWYEHARAAVRDLMYDRFLFWLELVVPRVVGQARELLDGSLPFRPSKWFSFFPFDQGLLDFMADADHFIETFVDIITGGASGVPHIYLSALPLTPKSSLVRKQFLARFPGVPIISPVTVSWARYIPPVTPTVYIGVISIDDSRLVAVTQSGRLELFDYPTGACLVRNCADVETESIACSPPGTIATGTRDGCIRLWDSTRLSACGVLGEKTDSPMSLRALCFTPDGAYLIALYEEFVVHWEVSSKHCLRRTSATTIGTSLTCSPTSHCVYMPYLAPGEGQSTSINVFEFSGDSAVSMTTVLLDTEGDYIVAMSHCPSSDSYRLAFLMGTSKGWFIDLRDVHHSEVLQGPRSAMIYYRPDHGEVYGHIAWSRDARFIIAAVGTYGIVLFDAQTLELVGSSHGGPREPYGSISFLPDDRSAIFYYNPRLQLPPAAYRVADLRRQSESPRVVYSVNGRFIKVRARDKTVTCWDTQTGTLTNAPDGCKWLIPSKRSRDDRFELSLIPGDFVSLCRLCVGNIRLHHSKNRTVVGLEISAQNPRAMAVIHPARFPDDDSDRGSFLKFWDTETGAEIGDPIQFPPCTLYAAMSPDGREVAVLVNGELRVFTVGASQENLSIVYANFTPQPTVDPETGEEYEDAALRCTAPDIRIPAEYWKRERDIGSHPRSNQPLMTVDFSSGCYGTNWARCFAG